MYDIIGDIHGHADELQALLTLLGYRETRGVYRHPERKVIFLGDFIDRGPQIKQVLHIVRHMVDDDCALAVMGNHELNALAFHHPQVPREKPRKTPYYRELNVKNIRQHAQTLLQLNDQNLKEALAWFATLPLWLELDGLRAVHACWDAPCMALIAPQLDAHRRIQADHLEAICSPTSQLFTPVEIILKGKEGALPPGLSYWDKDGHERRAVRTRWYLPTAGQTYGTYAFQSDPIQCDLPLDEKVIQAASPYPPADKPVFIGHYWLWAATPAPLADNVACLDYSVAKHGQLCAYSWNGEQQLHAANFRSVPSRSADSFGR